MDIEFYSKLLFESLRGDTNVQTVQSEDGKLVICLFKNPRKQYTNEFRGFEVKLKNIKTGEIV